MNYLAHPIADDEERTRMLRAISASEQREVSQRAAMCCAISRRLRAEAHRVCLHAERLRADPRTAGIPVLAVTGRSVEEFGEKARLFDGVLLKPVLPENLSNQIHETLEQSRSLRRRVAALRETTPLVVEKAQQLVAKSREGADASAEHARSIRACPKCHTDLQWIERLEIRGVTFDYYRPCTRGCGLFCYNHSERRFLPLTD